MYARIRHHSDHSGKVSSENNSFPRRHSFISMPSDFMVAIETTTPRPVIETTPPLLSNETKMPPNATETTPLLARETVPRGVSKAKILALTLVDLVTLGLLSVSVLGVGGGLVSLTLEVVMLLAILQITAMLGNTKKNNQITFWNAPHPLSSRPHFNEKSSGQK